MTHEEFEELIDDLIYAVRTLERSNQVNFPKNNREMVSAASRIRDAFWAKEGVSGDGDGK